VNFGEAQMMWKKQFFGDAQMMWKKQSQRKAWILDLQDDQVLPHHLHTIFRDAQITSKNEVNEIHGFSI
jgi:hypothetical protein